MQETRTGLLLWFYSQYGDVLTGGSPGSVSIWRTASCKMYKVIPTLMKLDQSRDISIKVASWYLLLAGISFLLQDNSISNIPWRLQVHSHLLKFAWFLPIVYQIATASMKPRNDSGKAVVNDEVRNRRCLEMTVGKQLLASATTQDYHAKLVRRDENRSHFTESLSRRKSISQNSCVVTYDTFE